MIRREEMFEAWAPPEGHWSPWVKPILFAHLPDAIDVDDQEPPDPVAPAPHLDEPGREQLGLEQPRWAPPSMEFPVPELPGGSPASGAPGAAAGPQPLRPWDPPVLRQWPAEVGWVSAPGTLLVIDLPGDGALEAWAAPALRRFRPVPLYNAAPGPRGPASAAEAAGLSHSDAVPLVDVLRIQRTLVRRTPTMRSLRLPLDAPPAFLLDAARGIGWTAPAPGRFDNRSISLPTDFPSANLLLSRGFLRAILIQEESGQPRTDLAHTLRRWQEAGLLILAAAGDLREPPRPLDVKRPSAFRAFWHALLARAGLRKNPLGGFGGYLPMPSSG